MTHYIPFFTERNGQQQRAACGAWAWQSDHSCTPECQGCLTWLQAEPERDADYEALVAEGPATNPVGPLFPDFDPTAPFPAKGRR